jgi:hypothetical protein
MNRRLWLVTCFLGLLSAPTVASAQPILERDPCGYASFPDKDKRDEYGKLARRLGESQPYGAVREEWRQVGKALRERMGDELFELWNDTYRVVMSSVRSPILDDVQVVLMDRCLSRIIRTPQKETEVIRADIEIMRALLALPNGEFERQFRARMKATTDALGSPYAASDTLRASLGLPLPN